jgi:hypothetical protein
VRAGLDQADLGACEEVNVVFIEIRPRKRMRFPCPIEGARKIQSSSEMVLLGEPV